MATVSIHRTKKVVATAESSLSPDSRTHWVELAFTEGRYGGDETFCVTLFMDSYERAQRLAKAINDAEGNTAEEVDDAEAA